MEIGIDCVEISRFNKEAFSNKKFIDRLFTKNEIQYCKSKTKSSQHFAARFAGKEATIKALSNYDTRIPPNQIEILSNKNGIPYVNILNEKCKDYEIKISLSHSEKIAMASVIISKAKKWLYKDW